MSGRNRKVQWPVARGPWRLRGSAACLAEASASTARDAAAASLIIVLVLIALSLAALPLLPRQAAADTH